MWKFIPAVLLFGLSLLTLFKAPTNFTWKVAILITEFCWAPILVTLIYGVFCWRSSNSYVSLNILNNVTLLLFCWPIFQAYRESSNLEQRVIIAFGAKVPEQAKSSPFSVFRFFNSKDENTYETKKYQTIDGKDYTYHWYPTKSKKKQPLVIVVHGGSWYSGDPQEIPALNAYLANRGVNVASIDYRLSPKYKYPAQVEDVETLYKLFIDHAEEWNIDTNRIFLLGRSAGGQIALQASYGPLKGKIAGVVTMYAPADMLWGAKQETNDWVLNVDKVLKDYIGVPVKGHEAAYLAASAPQLVDKDTPPTLIIHGKNDCMVSHHHSERLLKALKEHHVPCLLLDISCATHGCDYNFNGPSGQVSTFVIERFIANLKCKM